MSGIPRAEGIAQPLTELMDGRLSDESQGHLSVSDMEIEGAGPIPPEGLVGMEEFFNMPPFGIVFDEDLKFVAIPCGNEAFALIFILFFSAALHDLVEGKGTLFGELKREFSRCQSGPSMNEGFRGDMGHAFALRWGIGDRGDEAEGSLFGYVSKQFYGEMFFIRQNNCIFVIRLKDCRDEIQQVYRPLGGRLGGGAGCESDRLASMDV